MILKSRRLTGAFVAGVLMLGCAAAPFAAAQGQGAGWGPGRVILKEPKNIWPQTYSDVAPDPSVKFGTLPNGMRYAIMKNATPKGQASLRMRFDAGSLMERDDQQGLAHFLEHMAFNGSKNVPEGDMIKILERLGLAFGADTNASTGQEQTVYKLDLPKTDDETVDTALKLFREAASELLIQPAAVDRERGVVLSEERSRDDPGYRVFQEELKFLLGDHIAAKRMPIGKPEILRTAPASAISDYYHDYYRPERTVLVFVGDFDPAKMEEKIKAKFADWRPEGKAGAEPPLTLPVKRGPEVKVVVEPGAQLALGLSWVTPPDLDTDSTAERTEDLVESMGFAVLNRRFERLARAGDPPFIAAGGYRGDYFNSADVTSLQVNAQPGRWREGLTAAILEQRRLVQFGVTKAELDREIDGMRTSLQSQVARSGTRRTPGLAEEISSSVDQRIVQTNPTQDLAFFEKAVASVTPESVSAAIKDAFAGSGPLVFLASPTAVEGGEAAVKTALDAALAQPVTAGEALATKEWPYANFGTPGVIAEERQVADLGTTFIRFANGVRLTVKPTKFRDEQILVSVRLGAGMLSLPTDKITADWAASTVFMEGGLKDLTAEELDLILNTKVVGADINIGEDAITLNGGTRPEDLATEMQLLAAYATQPGWRPEPLQRMKQLGSTIHDQQDATASGVLSRELTGLLRSGDKRFAFPSKDEIAATSIADVRSLIEGQLANGPIEIVMVGDIDLAKAKAAVASTFGALPARPTAAWKTPAPAKLAFPAPNTTPVALTHKGRQDQAVGFVAWKTDDYFKDIHKARTLRVLGDILEIRLIDELRENQGKTYSPSVMFDASVVFPGYGYGAVMIETPPENLDGFFRDVDKIVGDMRDTPVTQDELDRAKRPAIEAMQKRLETNELWLNQLSAAQDDPRRLEAARTAVTGIQEITAADVQAAAKEYLKAGQTWKLTVKAAAK